MVALFMPYFTEVLAVPCLKCFADRREGWTVSAAGMKAVHAQRDPDLDPGDLHWFVNDSSGLRASLSKTASAFFVRDDLIATHPRGLHLRNIIKQPREESDPAQSEFPPSDSESTRISGAFKRIQAPQSSSQVPVAVTFGLSRQGAVAFGPAEFLLGLLGFGCSAEKFSVGLLLLSFLLASPPRFCQACSLWGCPLLSRVSEGNLAGP